MQRSFNEMLDGEGLSPEVVERAQRGLLLTHTLLGNRAAILRALRRDGPARVRLLRREGPGLGRLWVRLRIGLRLDPRFGLGLRRRGGQRLGR
jgi:hypothetical protein